MQATLYSPLPWRVEHVRQHPIVVDRHGAIVAATGHPLVQAESEAHLIAAAPELLEALREIAVLLSSDEPVEETAREALKTAAAAINKVEGNSW